MIKCNMGNLEIRGSAIDLLADLSTIVHALKNDFDEAGLEHTDDMLKRAFDNGMMTKEELEAEVESAKMKSADLLQLDEAFKEIIGIIKNMQKGKEKKDGRAEE